MTSGSESCRECGTIVNGRFCADCGAENRAPLRSFGQWLRGSAGQFFELDVRLFRTLPRLFFSPGWLTVEYAAGKQRRYTPPIRLYVVTSAIVIAAMNVHGAFQLDEFLAGFNADARTALAAAVGIANLADPDVQESFNRRMDLVFPILNLFSPVGMMLLLKAVYPRRYAQEHLVFGCHYATFLTVVTLPLLMLDGGVFLVVTGIVTVTSVLYLTVAMHRVYRGRWMGLVARLVFVGIGFLVMIGILSNISLYLVLASI